MKLPCDWCKGSNCHCDPNDIENYDNGAKDPRIKVRTDIDGYTLPAGAD